MTLALLITAVGGAWADETYPIVYDFEAAANAVETFGNKNGSGGTGQGFYGWESAGKPDWPRQDYKGYTWGDGQTSTNLPQVCHVWRRSDRMDASSGNISNGGLQCPSDKQMAVDGLTEGLTVTIIYDATNATNKEIVWAIGDGSSQSLGEPRATATINGVEAVPGETTIKSGDVITVNSVTEAQNGSGYIVFKVMKDMVIKKIIIDEAKAEPDVEVTTDAAEEGATFTEASFQMPAFDATAEYELVRDMSVEMTAQVGDGTQEQPRYRVKKDGNKFIPADMEMAAVPALFTVNDAIEQKALTQTDYIVEIYAIDAEGQPTGDPMTFATFTFEPGIYAVKAVAAQGSDYDGETALSNTFKLFQGYEVEVAAKEFITYYKDEPLYADTETSADAQIYTIQSVSGDQAQLSAAIETAPSYTPLLIFNNSDQDKTFLLIPANEEPSPISYYGGFIGTTDNATILASTEGTTNYALNGKAFVFVKNDLAIGANKAWLSVSNANARAINLVFSDETTKITNTNLTNLTNGNWYDLNGRKLQGMPTKKGVYILNGKKVVVK